MNDPNYLFVFLKKELSNLEKNSKNPKKSYASNLKSQKY
jgi:hypothetical protein